MHALAIEDASTPGERIKLDRYPEHLFLNLRTAKIGDELQVDSTEISAFVAERTLITVFKTHPMAGIDDLLSGQPLLPEHGVGSLLHAVLDVVVDGHLHAVGALEAEADRLADMLDDSSERRAVRDTAFRLRQSISRLRRVVAPMTEVLDQLLQPDTQHPFVSEALRPYFDDIKDHASRARADVDAARDVVLAVIQMNLAEQGNDLNQTMKQLAAWAAIITAPTALTGYFGQNLPFPGYGTPAGAIVSAVLVVTTVIGLFILFRRNHWL